MIFIDKFVFCRELPENGFRILLGMGHASSGNIFDVDRANPSPQKIAGNAMSFSRVVEIYKSVQKYV